MLVTDDTSSSDDISSRILESSAFSAMVYNNLSGALS
jgi:hypothetical protein